MAHQSEPETFIDKLEAVVPENLTRFDTFPKLPSTYKTRTDSRGFLTLLVSLLAFLLVLNDIGEYIWGWPDYEFSIDAENSSSMDINVDMVVNMPCGYLSVDLRDAVGDRLYLSNGFKRDGTLFDIGQATLLQEHTQALSVRQAIAQSRKSRGLLDTILRRDPPPFKPTYNYRPDGSACRIFGTVTVKKVTANLHVTTLGHGYTSRQHVDHSLMNLSHVITEFSFGPYFPDIAQPLDNSFELTHEPFIAYQYFLHVVPTTYIPPRSHPLRTNQYSVTHYTHQVDHGQGTPGIFFKFELDPLHIAIHQRSTTFGQFFIRCIGVVGGLFVCVSYAVRIGTKAIEVVTGTDPSSGLVPPTATKATGARSKWTGGDIRARGKVSDPVRVVQQGSGWVVEKDSPYGSPYNSPYLGASHSILVSPYLPNSPGTPSFGPPPSVTRSSFGPVSPVPPSSGTRSPSVNAPPPYSPQLSHTSPLLSHSTPSNPNDATAGTPLHNHFPPTPGPSDGFGDAKRV
ncbi:DUF1692-domain-containing protein [Thelephora terrestris]|uniref:DUF1692-domain-containing protein n=1 Tax=Thelephora terrestris TaxID=56493 RepID=A0A9P6LA08_9AGAM|nr:DUF1692-domain-containing protein [Thelephora terrestris]